MPFPQRVIPTRTDIEDVYQENTQNILQKTSVSNMIGLLDQLNKISVFASEIFSDILQVTETNSKRIKKIKTRIGGIQSRLEPTEKLFLDNSPSYFYDNPFTGKEWQRKDPLRGLLFRRDRASKAVNVRRSVGLPLPDLSALDRISVSGPCIKKYSDSNFFMNEWLEAEKKKMEEEKAKRREKKKKRKKRKRQQKEKIQGIERWVYDPITGKKVKKKATQIAVKKYELTDSTMGAIDFESADKATRDRMMSGNTKSDKKAKSSKQKSKQKAVSNLSSNPSHQQGGPSYGGNIPNINANKQAGGGPPPVPGNSGPPPVPGSNSGPPPVPGNSGPPPVPGNTGPPAVPGGNSGPPPVPGNTGPPPVPRPQIKKKLTGAEMAALSRQNAEQSGAYRKEVVHEQKEPSRPKPLVPMGSSALLAGIRGGMQLKKTTQVKREPKMEKRDLLLAALKKKKAGGLRKVQESEKNVKKEEKIDNTIFAILNRRQFMADDSDSESGSSWSSDD